MYQKAEKQVTKNQQTAMLTYTAKNAGYYYLQGYIEQMNSDAGYKLASLQASVQGWLCAASLSDTGTYRNTLSTIYKLNAGETVTLYFQHSMNSTVNVQARMVCVWLA